MTFDQALQEFLIDQQIKGNTAKTRLYYEKSLAIFIAFIREKPVEALTMADLKAYSLSLMNKGTMSTTTVQTYVRALRAFLSWCWRDGYISENLPERYRLPKAKKYAVDVLTDSEINTVLSCFDLKTDIGLRNYCICSLMLDSGLRLNEVATIDVNNMHIPDGFLIVDGKGNKQRIVPIGLNTKKHLMKYLSRRSDKIPHTAFFLQDEDIPINDNTIAQLFKRLKRRTKIPRLKAHLLRHTFATRYLENGGDIYSLQLILGHTSLEMVKRYVHTTPRKIIGRYSAFSPMDLLGK